MPSRSKEANKRYQSVWYSKNKELHKSRVRKNKEELKNWFYEWKSSLCCSICGENRVPCLDFHHIDPTDKKFTMARLASWSKNRILEESDKCIILCSNCHRWLHYTGQGKKDSES